MRRERSPNTACGPSIDSAIDVVIPASPKLTAIAVPARFTERDQAPDHINAEKNSSPAPSTANHGTVCSDARPCAPTVKRCPFAIGCSCRVNG